jgi:type I restriction enzyme S subunit
MYWILLSKTFSSYIDYIKTGTTISHLYQETFDNFIFQAPSPEEQQRISHFLDVEVSRINQSIEGYINLIKLFQEKRIALIGHVITKGLNPNVKMKNSGVEWIGKIPEQWEVRRIKNVCRVNPPKSTLKVKNDDLVSFLPMEKVSESGAIELDTNKSFEEVSNGFTCFADGDIIVAKITPCFENGKGAVIEGLMNGVGCGSTEFHVLRPLRDKAIAKFIYYLTMSHLFRNTGQKFMKGVAGQQRVPTEFIENFKTSIPSVSEQRAIILSLENNLKKIDSLIEKIKKQIDFLYEYKTSLISHVVTGKIDVRDEVLCQVPKNIQ